MLYKKTTTKAITEDDSPVYYCIGRDDDMINESNSEGGFAVFILREETVDGETRKRWEAVDRGLSYNETVDVMNEKVGREAFEKNELLT